MFPNLDDYSQVIDLISYLNAEVVVFFSAPGDGGGIVKGAADKGEEWFIVGSREWQEESFYDAATQEALAIEHAGDVNTESWTQSMFAVTGGDGNVVYTYDDGIAALRAGEKINYDGVTGSMEYSDTGVVSGIVGIFKWNPDKSLEKVQDVDGVEVLRFSR